MCWWLWKDPQSVYFFFFPPAVSPYSVALVSTFKHNRIDYKIQVLKTNFIFLNGNLQMILLFSQWYSNCWWQISCKNFKNLTAVLLVSYPVWVAKNNFMRTWCFQFPSSAALALLNFLSYSKSFFSELHYKTPELKILFLVYFSFKYAKQMQMSACIFQLSALITSYRMDSTLTLFSSLQVYE